MIPLRDTLDLRGPIWGTLALLLAYLVLAIAGEIPHMNGWQVLVALIGLWLFAPYVERRAGTPLFLAAFLIVAVATGFLVGAVDESSGRFAVSFFLPVLATAGAHLALAPRSRILCLLPVPFAMTFVEVPTIAMTVIWVALQMLLTAV
ncbi:MAG: rhomboid family intramembrane serine protease [Solirubrobacterales bacterium]|nr:rhomboid family intramembrane serine protease [Solirubrobacterales bacterium]